MADNEGQNLPDIRFNLLYPGPMSALGRGLKGFLFMGLLLSLTACPKSTSPSATAKGTGLLGEYFITSDFAGPEVAQIDSQIAFDWQDKAPVSGMQPQAFSVRWSGFVVPEITQEYVFSAPASGDVHLWLAGELVLSPLQGEAKVRLEAGKRYPIRVEFAKTRPRASVKLQWHGKNQTPQVVPQEQLFPNDFNAQKAVLIPVPFGENLIRNPGFEEGVFAWSRYGQGSYSLRLDQGENGQVVQTKGYLWLEQTIPFGFIQADARYTLEGWGRLMEGQSCKLGFQGGKPGSGTTFARSENFSKTWSQQSLALEIPLGTSWATVYLETAKGGRCEFDALRLVASTLER